MPGIEIAKPDWEGLPKDQKECGLCKRPMGDDKYVYYCKEENCWVHKGCIHEWLPCFGDKVFANRSRIHILEESLEEGKG